MTFSSSDIKPRRKPSQSRAWMTSEAIQDAFLIVLLEKSYEAVSMRDIAGVAGVGLGTLYLYFPNKGSIAAVAVRRWVRTLAAALAKAGEDETQPRRTLLHKADALVHAYVQLVLERPAPWRALIMLERRISSLDIYGQLYRVHVDIVRQTLAGASDPLAGPQLEAAAFTVFTIVDGMVRNSLLTLPRVPEEDALTREIQQAVRGYLQAAVGTSCGGEGRPDPIRDPARS